MKNKNTIPAVILAFFFCSYIALSCSCEARKNELIPGQDASSAVPAAEEKTIESKNETLPVQVEEEKAANEEEVKEDDRIWPSHPLAREVLVDPADPKNCSYWRDARVGDWVRFLNHRKNVIIFMVTAREGSVVRFTSKEYKLTGEQMPEAKPDIRERDINKADEDMKGSILNNRLVRRHVHEWQLYKADKKLMCERHFVPNPITGENNENIWSRDVRCGGLVKMRRGRHAIVTLIDYGDAQHPPKWDHLKQTELLSYWYVNDHFTGVKPVFQEDDPRGEPPEKPEDPPTEEIVREIESMERMVGSEFPEAIKTGEREELKRLLYMTGMSIDEIASYAKENNLPPALTQAKKVVDEWEKLKSASLAGDNVKAMQALKEFHDLLEWLFLSVGYEKKGE